jgi:hypothetical protein
MSTRDNATKDSASQMSPVSIIRATDSSGTQFCGRLEAESRIRYGS